MLGQQGEEFDGVCSLIYLSFAAKMIPLFQQEYALFDIWNEFGHLKFSFCSWNGMRSKVWRFLLIHVRTKLKVEVCTVNWWGRNDNFTCDLILLSSQKLQYKSRLYGETLQNLYCLAWLGIYFSSLNNYNNSNIAKCIVCVL